MKESFKSYKKGKINESAYAGGTNKNQEPLITLLCLE